MAAFRFVKDREGARESMVFPEWIRRRCQSRAFSDRATAEQSAIKLLGYDILHYATGHGPFRKGRRPALEAAIARETLYAENYCGSEARYAEMSTISSSVNFSTAGFIVAEFFPCRAPVLKS